MNTVKTKHFRGKFPKSVFVDVNNVRQQVNHVYSEMLEVLAELPKDNEYVNRDGVIDAFTIEVLDLYHSVESLLRILDKDHHIPVTEAMQKVIIKNQLRGYYPL